MSSKRCSSVVIDDLHNRDLGNWKLDIPWDLGFGFWDFSRPKSKSHQREPYFRLPLPFTAKY